MAAGCQPRRIWRWTVEWIDTPETMDDLPRGRGAFRDDGTQLPFVTIDQATGDVIGSTPLPRTIDQRNHHRLEIGYTWLVPSRQRGGANLEAKLLQLTHAFETLGCRRVQFKTDSLNDKSRNALLGIGATFEGIFRNQHDQPGRPDAALRLLHRSIDEEWPGVKAHLQGRLARHLGGAPRRTRDESAVS